MINKIQELQTNLHLTKEIPRHGRIVIPSTHGI